MKKFLLLLFLCPLWTLASDYYPSTTTQANSLALKAGDIVYLKAGTPYGGVLKINYSNVKFLAYGTGAQPSFNGIVLTNVNHVDITGLLISDVAYGISMTMATYINVSGCTISRCGVSIEAPSGCGYCSITGNIINNGVMVRNTSTVKDDDYGGGTIVIGSPGNIIQANTFQNLEATSYDYGYDGGAVEFFGADAKNNLVTGNTVIDCCGSFEFGSNNGGAQTGNIITGNTLINSGLLFWINNYGQYYVTVPGLQIINNTIIETKKQFTKPAYQMATYKPADPVILNNNLFWLTSGIFCGSGTVALTRNGNLYHFENGSKANYDLNSTEGIVNNVFKSTTGDPATWERIGVTDTDSVVVIVPTVPPVTPTKPRKHRRWW